jgi:hypothetical protein
MQEFTTEFRKKAIQMGVSLKSLEMLVKYLVEFLPHIRRKLMLFRLKKSDKANIKEKYIEGDKRKKQASAHKQVEP